MQTKKGTNDITNKKTKQTQKQTYSMSVCACVMGTVCMYSFGKRLFNEIKNQKGNLIFSNCTHHTVDAKHTKSIFFLT